MTEKKADTTSSKKEAIEVVGFSSTKEGWTSRGVVKTINVERVESGPSFEHSVIYPKEIVRTCVRTKVKLVKGNIIEKLASKLCPSTRNVSIMGEGFRNVSLEIQPNGNVKVTKIYDDKGKEVDEAECNNGVVTYDLKDRDDFEIVDDLPHLITISMPARKDVKIGEKIGEASEDYIPKGDRNFTGTSIDGKIIVFTIDSSGNIKVSRVIHGTETTSWNQTVFTYPL